MLIVILIDVSAQYRNLIWRTGTHSEIWPKVFLWLFSDENVESCHIGILYDILRLPHEVRVERDHKLQVHNILFIQIRVCVGAYAAGRKVMWAGDGWGFLQISIGLRTPRSLRTANSLSKGFENCLSLLSVAQRIIFRKPHPSPAFVTFLFGSLIVLSALHTNLNSSLKVNDTNILTTAILNLHITK